MNALPDGDYAGEQLAPRRSHIALSPSDSSLMLDALIARVAEFQDRVFPTQPVKGTLVHLSKEVTELRADPNDRFEWADVFLLFLAGLHKHGMTFDDLLIAAHQKMDINLDRKWHPADCDGCTHHIEEGK